MFDYLEEDIRVLIKNSEYTKIIELTKKNIDQNPDMDIISLKNNHFILAKAYYSLTKNKQAFEHITQVLEVLDKHKFSSIEIIDAKIEYAKILRRMGKQELSMEIYSDILDSHKDTIEEREQATVYHNLANLYMEQGYFERSRELFQTVLEIDQRNHNEEGQAHTLSSLGGLFFYLGNYPEAIEYYHQSLKVRRKLNDALGEATVSLNLGAVYANQLEEKLALEFLDNAERLFNKMDHQRGIQNVLSTKARMNFSLGKYSQVIENLKYFEGKTEIDITKTDLSLILILSESLLKEKLILEAKKVIELGLNGIQRLTNGKHDELVHDYGKLKQMLSQVAVFQNNFDEALLILDELENISKDIKDNESLIAIYHAKSHVNLSLKKYEQALTFAEKGKELANKFKEPSIVNLLELIFEINFVLGEFKQCIRNLNEISKRVQITNELKYEVILRTFKLLENEKLHSYKKLFSNLFKLSQFERSLYLAQDGFGRILELNSHSKKEDFLNMMEERIQRDMKIINSENDEQPSFEKKTIDILSDREQIKELSLFDMLDLLSQLFFSIKYNHIPEKYLFEIDWSDMHHEETKPIIQLKQLILKELYHNNFNLENIQTGDQSIDCKFNRMFTKFNALTIELQNNTTNENRIMLMGIIVSIIIGTFNVLYFSDLDEKECKND
jgi:tetratricopeptide (TPR) repeat protein